MPTPHLPAHLGLRAGTFLATLLAPRAARGAPEGVERSPGAMAPADLQALNRGRIRAHARALAALGLRTLLHAGVGITGALTARTEARRAFFLMNALFQVPVLGSAAVAARVLARQDPSRLSLAESLRRGVQLERGLLVGITLDVLSTGAGAWLWERGLRQGSARLRGFGRALVLQGTTLLLFDAALTLLDVGYERRLFLLEAPAPEGASAALRPGP